MVRQAAHRLRRLLPVASNQSATRVLVESAHPEIIATKTVNVIPLRYGIWKPRGQKFTEG